MREAVIVAAVRTPAGRAKRGTLKNTRPDDLAALVLKEAILRAGIEAGEVQDIILGCAFPEGEQGMNVARIAAQRAGFPPAVPGATVNRFCASGLESIALAAARIQTGMMDVVVAGGVESMTMVPMGGNKLAPNPYLVDHYPEAYISMGLTAERVAERFKVTREEMDEFALKSHQKAAAAREKGNFKEEIIPVLVQKKYYDRFGRLKVEETPFDFDEGVRPDTTLEGLAGLKPAFMQGGTVTAGNSSQMNDAAAALVLMAAEKAEALGLKPLARFRSYAVGGVDPDVMGIGPVAAIPRALEKAGVSLDDLDLIELNEAFAAQALAVIKELGLPTDRLNVNGGAIALGHPLGCTGSKLTTSLIYELKRRGGGLGLVSMCIGGGMGAAGVFEVF